MANLAVVAPDKQLRRKKRLMAIVENGLPPFRHTLMNLIAILNNPSADIRKAAAPIRMDPALTARVLQMCNSPLFGRHSRVISIEQAAALLGAERLRSLAMTSALQGFVGQSLPKAQLNSFWRHSVLAAMLSKHLAEYFEYFEAEQAYIAGLLHDVGQVPQWKLVIEERIQDREDLRDDEWPDNPVIQRGCFGIDHCELGSNMDQSWNLMPSLIDVLLKHHEPLEAHHDPYLVQIVAGVEHYLLMKERSESVLLSSAIKKSHVIPLLFRSIAGRYSGSRRKKPTALFR